MKFLIDTHSHTIASGHAYSTINEMILAASKKGLKLLCITDHTPNMPGAAHEIYFRNFKVIDRFLHGVEVFMGAELNLIDYEGGVDLPVKVLRRLDVCIASFHTICLKSGTLEENTNTFLKVMDNPYVNIIGHPENGSVPINFEAIVEKAKNTNTLIEVNNSSLKPNSSRTNTHENLKKLLETCKKIGAFITIGSDSHFYTQVGENELAIKLINEVNFPHELIINTNVQKFKEFIQIKRKNIIEKI